MIINKPFGYQSLYDWESVGLLLQNVGGLDSDNADPFAVGVDVNN